MAERRNSSRDVTIASPLYSAGVHKAEVNSPVWSAEVPDPMGYMSSEGTQAGHLTTGGGDDVNDWAEQFPDRD